MAHEVVLDSSAVVALIREESGAEKVASRLAGAAMSIVNVTEAADVLVRSGLTPSCAASLIAKLDMAMLAPDLDGALMATAMYLATRKAGLSLGDRYCLALAKRLDRPALTGDRRWLEVADDVGVKVELFR